MSSIKLTIFAIFCNLRFAVFIFRIVGINYRIAKAIFGQASDLIAPMSMFFPRPSPAKRCIPGILKWQIRKPRQSIVLSPIQGL